MRLRLAWVVRSVARGCRTCILIAALATRVVGEELVDQTLEYDRRLRLVYAAAILEIGVETPRAQANVLAPEQPLRLDARIAVLGNLVVLRIDTHGDHGLVVLGIEADARHLAEAHARHRYRGSHLEIADVVECGGHVVAGFGATKLEAA